MGSFQLIYAARFNRALQKFFSTKGGPPAPDLAPEIIPVLQIPGSDAADQYLWSWELFGQILIMPAGGVGQATSIQFSNPAGSKIIAEVLRWTHIGGAAADTNVQMSVGAAAPLVSAAGAAGQFDSRSRANPVCSLTGGQAVGNLPSSVMVNSWTAGFMQDLWTPSREFALPVLPGRAIRYTGSIAQNGMSASVWWRERALEESELT